MGYEETVMSDKELLQSFLGLRNISTITEYAAEQDMNTPPGLYFKNGAQAQAEITWKARDEEVVEAHKAGVMAECEEWLNADTSTQLSKARKAGYEAKESEFELAKVALWEVYDNGIKQGIKEVLEQYKAIRACTHMVGLHHLADCKECEQAKLKEWGI